MNFNQSQACGTVIVKIGSALDDGHCGLNHWMKVAASSRAPQLSVMLKK